MIRLDRVTRVAVGGSRSPRTVKARSEAQRIASGVASIAHESTEQHGVRVVPVWVWPCPRAVSGVTRMVLF